MASPTCGSTKLQSRWACFGKRLGKTKDLAELGRVQALADAAVQKHNDRVAAKKQKPVLKQNQTLEETSFDQRVYYAALRAEGITNPTGLGGGCRHNLFAYTLRLRDPKLIPSETALLDALAVSGL